MDQYLKAVNTKELADQNTHPVEYMHVLTGIAPTNKKISLDEDGCIKIEGFKKPSYQDAPNTYNKYVVHIDEVDADIDTMFAYLQHVSSEPENCLIFDELRPEHEGKKVIQATTHYIPEKKQIGYLQAKADGTYLLLVDIDGEQCPEGLNFITDTEKCIDYALKLYPECLHNVSYVYQVSSSAGMENEGYLPDEEDGLPLKGTTINAHLFFVLSSPQQTSKIKAWANNTNVLAKKKLFDPTVYNVAHLTYTATPTFDGVADPFEGKRWGIVHKEKSKVDFPEVVMPIAEHIEYAIPTESLPKSKFDALVLDLGKYKYKLAAIGDHEASATQPKGDGLHMAQYRAAYAFAESIKDPKPEHIAPLVAEIKHATINAVWKTAKHQPSSDYHKARIKDAYLEGVVKKAFSEYEKFRSAKVQEAIAEKRKKLLEHGYEPSVIDHHFSKIKNQESYIPEKSYITKEQGALKLEQLIKFFINAQQNMMIAMSAGGGKTSALVKEVKQIWLWLEKVVAEGQETTQSFKTDSGNVIKLNVTKNQRPTMEIYVPDHKIGFEVYQALTKSEGFGKSSGNVVQHLYSRDIDIRDTEEELFKKAQCEKKGTTYKPPAYKQCYYVEECKACADIGVSATTMVCKVSVDKGIQSVDTTLKGKDKIIAIHKAIDVSHGDGGDTFEETCEYYTQCGYNRQRLGTWDEKEQAWKGGAWNIRILMHSMLGNNRGFYEREKPMLAVCDETTIKSYLRGCDDNEPRLTFAQIMESPCSEKFKKLFLKAKKDGLTLKYLREGMGGKQALLNEIDTTLKIMKDDKKKISVVGLPQEMKLEAIKLLAEKTNIKTMLENLRVELMTDRDELYSLERVYKIVINPTKTTQNKAERVYENEYRLLYRYDSGRLSNVPTLLLDATMPVDLNKHIYGDMECHEINVPRNVTIHQCWDEFVGSRWMKNRSEEGKFIKEMQQVINRESKNGKVKIAVIGPMWLVGNENPKNKVKGKLTIPNDYGYFGHHGGIRGLDYFKDAEVFIIIGNNMPPLDALQRMAKAMYYDTKEPLKLYKEGEHMATLPRRMKTRTGFSRAIETYVHKDPRVQMLQEQVTREADIIQALDRGRFIHNTNENRKVLLFTNLPSDITVDICTTYKDMISGKTRLTSVFNELEGVVPINETWLGEECLHLGNVDAWRDYFRREVGEKTLEALSLSLLIPKSTPLSLMRFKEKGSKAKAFNVLTKWNLEQTQERLSKLMNGVEIEPF